MKKLQDYAFRKDVYLLGKDRQGTKYWLEAPSWDCGWYWGFGYVETYQQNWLPSKARDINSHEHANGEFKPVILDDEKRRSYNSYDSDTNIFTGQYLVEKSFNDKEGWLLRELMATFYQLKEQAQLAGRGGMHQTTNPLADLLKDEKEAKRINEILIPAVTSKILEILTPKKA